jgi:hypothetical protein
VVQFSFVMTAQHILRLNPMRRIDGAMGTRFNIVVDGSTLPDFTSPQGRASAKLLTQRNVRFAERVSMLQSEAARCLPITHRTFNNMLNSFRGTELLIVETDTTDERLRRLRFGETFGSKSADPLMLEH